jgi:hypothetical protein
MQPISRAAANSGWQMEPAGESNDTAQLVPGARSDAHEAQGTYLNLSFAVATFLTGHRKRRF